MRVESVLLENMKQVMLVMRMQEVEIKEGFGAIGAGDGKDAVVNAERGEGIEMEDMGCAKGTGEGAGTNEADNEEGGENEAEDKASDAECKGEGSGEDAGEWEQSLDGVGFLFEYPQPAAGPFLSPGRQPRGMGPDAAAGRPGQCEGV